MSINQIPKKIHQIWWQGERFIPENYNKFRKTILDLNPDYEYKLWSELDFLNLIKDDDILLKKYYKFEYMIQKFDFMKYCILYKFGGIFIDIDTYLNQKLDKLFDLVQDYDVVISYIGELDFVGSYFACGKFRNCINNGNLIAKPESDFMKYLIEKIETSCEKYIAKSFCISNTTGPIKFNKILDAYKLEKGPKSKIKILDNEYMEPCFYDMCKITDNTFLVHKHLGSWLNSSTLELVKFYTKNSKILWLVIIILIFYSIYGIKEIKKN